MQLFACHPTQVQQTVTQDSIIIEDLVEFPNLEEQDFIVVITFYVPVLLHTSTEFDELISRHEQRAYIVVRIIRPSPFDILNVFFADEVGSGVDQFVSQV